MIVEAWLGLPALPRLSIRQPNSLVIRPAVRRARQNCS
jgi:hypothetical protein